MSLQVGDKIKIKTVETLLKEYEDQDGNILIPDWNVTTHMRQFCGTEATITEVHEYTDNDNNQYPVYKVAEDPFGYYWISEMIEPFSEEDYLGYLSKQLRREIRKQPKSQTPIDC